MPLKFESGLRTFASSVAFLIERDDASFMRSESKSTYQLVVNNEPINITESAIETTVHRFVEGAVYDLAESVGADVGDGFAYITRHGTMMTSEELDAIRDHSIQKENR